jgi:hypothetical protein
MLIMRKFTVILLVLAMALSFSACSRKYSEGGERLKVKCPACGYEFETREAR